MENKTFEENMNELEKIVEELEKGNVPLEEAMEKFKVGVTLSKKLEKTLATAEQTLTQVVMDDDSQKNIDETTLDLEN